VHVQLNAFVACVSALQACACTRARSTKKPLGTCSPSKALQQASATMQNDEFLGADDNDVLRRQRQQRLFQTGLLVVFLLLLLDNKAPPDANSAANDPAEGPGGGKIPPAINSLKAAVLDFPKESGVAFAQNVTGYYKGEWQSVTKADTSALIPEIDFSVNDTAHSTARDAKLHFDNTNGAIVFQLASLPLLGLETEISLVRGLIKLVDGPADTRHDATYSVEGIYLHR
jgi:hypothetical protein